MSRTLVLVRHGQSEWNLKNLFTGWRDPGLTEQGHAEAKAAGQRLKAAGLKFDLAYTSGLSRAQVTCQHILDEIGVPPPGGESLKDTGARVWPYYLHTIQPHVLRGETILVAAHGNSLRALIMALDGLTPEEILKQELNTGVPIIYKLNADSTVASKEVLSA
jgi:2,3-bisphosphoglycerate-dependent phosphoglycerate mutase